MIDKAARVGVVLLDRETALVLEEAIEDMRRLVGGGGDDLGVERAELVGDGGVEGDTRIGPMARVDAVHRRALAAGREVLTVGGGGRPRSPREAGGRVRWVSISAARAWV